MQAQFVFHSFDQLLFVLSGVLGLVDTASLLEVKLLLHVVLVIKLHLDGLQASRASLWKHFIQLRKWGIIVMLLFE